MRTVIVTAFVAALIAPSTSAQVGTSTTEVFVNPPPLTNPPGTGPALTPRVTQADITNGSMTLKDIRQAGMRIFSTERWRRSAICGIRSELRRGLLKR